MKKMTYKEKFIQMNKEARATWILFFIMAAWWLGTGLGLKDVQATILGLPLWIFLSTIGTVILGSIGTVILTKFVFKNFSLEDDDEGEEQNHV